MSLKFRIFMVGLILIYIVSTGCGKFNRNLQNPSSSNIMGENQSEYLDYIVTLKEGVDVNSFLANLNLSEYEIKDMHIGASGTWFRARITNLTFEKLKHTEGVLSIYKPMKMKTQTG